MFVIVLLLFVSGVHFVLGQQVNTFRVHFGASNQGDQVIGSVTVGNTTWFDLDTNTAVHANGTWNSQSQHSLKLMSRQ
jgi:hypothetical protein